MNNKVKHVIFFVIAHTLALTNCFSQQFEMNSNGRLKSIPSMFLNGNQDIIIKSDTSLENQYFLYKKNLLRIDSLSNGKDTLQEEKVSKNTIDNFLLNLSLLQLQDEKCYNQIVQILKDEYNYCLNTEEKIIIGWNKNKNNSKEKTSPGSTALCDCVKMLESLPEFIKAAEAYKSIQQERQFLIKLSNNGLINSKNYIFSDSLKTITVKWDSAGVSKSKTIKFEYDYFLNGKKLTRKTDSLFLIFNFQETTAYNVRICLKKVFLICTMHLPTY
jgi:hypothetical protein